MLSLRPQKFRLPQGSLIKQSVSRLAAQTLSMAVASGLLLACTASNPPPGYYQFGTLITDEGLKLFELRYPLPQREFRPSTQSQQIRAPRDPHEKSEKLALNFLQNKLDASAFCREGYMLLGRHAGLTAQRIRGECKERAIPADREKFPDTIEQW